MTLGQALNTITFLSVVCNKYELPNSNRCFMETRKQANGKLTWIDKCCPPGCIFQKCKCVPIGRGPPGYLERGMARCARGITQVRRQRHLPVSGHQVGRSGYPMPRQQFPVHHVGRTGYPMPRRQFPVRYMTGNTISGNKRQAYRTGTKQITLNEPYPRPYMNSRWVGQRRQMLRRPGKIYYKGRGNGGIHRGRVYNKGFTGRGGSVVYTANRLHKPKKKYTTKKLRYGRYGDKMDKRNFKKFQKNLQLANGHHQERKTEAFHRTQHVVTDANEIMRNAIRPGIDFNSKNVDYYDSGKMRKYGDVYGKRKPLDNNKLLGFMNSHMHHDHHHHHHHGNAVNGGEDLHPSETNIDLSGSGTVTAAARRHTIEVVDSSSTGGRTDTSSTDRGTSLTGGLTDFLQNFSGGRTSIVDNSASGTVDGRAVVSTNTRIDKSSTSVDDGRSVIDAGIGKESTGVGGETSIIDHRVSETVDGGTAIIDGTHLVVTDKESTGVGGETSIIDNRVLENVDGGTATIDGAHLVVTGQGSTGVGDETLIIDNKVSETVDGGTAIIDGTHLVVTGKESTGVGGETSIIDNRVSETVDGGTAIIDGAHLVVTGKESTGVGGETSIIDNRVSERVDGGAVTIDGAIRGSTNTGNEIKTIFVDGTVNSQGQTGSEVSRIGGDSGHIKGHTSETNIRKETIVVGTVDSTGHPIDSSLSGVNGGTSFVENRNSGTIDGNAAVIDGSIKTHVVSSSSSISGGTSLSGQTSGETGQGGNTKITRKLVFNSTKAIIGPGPDVGGEATLLVDTRKVIGGELKSGGGLHTENTGIHTTNTLIENSVRENSLIDKDSVGGSLDNNQKIVGSEFKKVEKVKIDIDGLRGLINRNVDASSSGSGTHSLFIGGKTHTGGSIGTLTQNTVDGTKGGNLDGTTVFKKSSSSGTNSFTSKDGNVKITTTKVNENTADGGITRQTKITTKTVTKRISKPDVVATGHTSGSLIDATFPIIGRTEEQRKLEVIKQETDRTIGGSTGINWTVDQSIQHDGSYLPMDICEECEIDDGGIGYTYHPVHCDMFIMCIPSPDGNMSPVAQVCPHGQFWAQLSLTCRPSHLVKCPLDICFKRETEMEGKTYAHRSNCRSYWQCVGGYSHEQCCPRGHSYNNELGCIPDSECQVACGQEMEKPINWTKKCEMRAISGKPRKYEWETPNGWIEMNCAPGTIFYEELCGCVYFDNPIPGTQDPVYNPNPDPELCSPEVHLPFDDFSDYSGKNTYVYSHNVTLTGNSVACFDGDSYISLPMFTNMHLGQKLYAKIIYKQPFTTEPQALLYNGDCHKNPSLVVTTATTKNHIEVTSAYHEFTQMDLMSSTPANEWRHVTLSINGDELNAKTDQDAKRLKIEGGVARTQCGLKIGWGQNYPGFVGCIDDFILYRCFPGGM